MIAVGAGQMILIQVMVNVGMFIGVMAGQPALPLPLRDLRRLRA